MANPNNWKQHSEQKAAFTDYTVAGTDEGRAKAADLRLAYMAQRADIELQRHLRQASIMDDPTDCSQVRRGYPKKRQRDEDIPSKRGVPHSKFLNQFKLVEHLLQVPPYHVVKIFVLHATRGWKAFA